MASNYSQTTTQGGNTSTTTTTTQDAGKVSNRVKANRSKYNKGYQQSAQVQNYYNQLQDNMSYRPSDAVNQAYANYQNYANGYQQSDAVKQAYANLQSKMNYGGYDFNRDAVYQSYKDIYTQQGKAAMRDTMAQTAAMTGGYGNSWSQTAGQQQYQAYLQQLNNMIPQLAENDYNRWNSERSFAMDYYRDARDFDYNQFARERENAYNIYNSERGFDYGKFTDDRSFLANMYQQERNFDYSQWESNRNFWNDEYWRQRKSKQTSTNKTTSSNWSTSTTSSWSGGGGGSGGSGRGGGDDDDPKYPSMGPYKRLPYNLLQAQNSQYFHLPEDSGPQKAQNTPYFHLVDKKKK